MAQADFMFPAYSSANPAIAELFRNEFAQRQAGQHASEVLAAQDTARAEIAARLKLAQEQQRANQEQQNYNNLFRMAEFQDRKATGDENTRLLKRQLDIEEAYKKGIVAKPGVRNAADEAAFAKDSETIANQLNAAYQNKLAVGRAAAKKIYDDKVAGLHFWQSGDDAKRVLDQVMSDLEDKTFNEVQDLATRYYPPASFRVDPFTKQFLPVGKVSPASGPTPLGGPPSAEGSLFGPPGTPVESGDVPFTLIDLQGNRHTFPTREALDAAAGAALGATPTPAMAPPVNVTPMYNYQNGKLQKVSGQ